MKSKLIILLVTIFLSSTLFASTPEPILITRPEITGLVQPRYEYSRRNERENLSSFYMRRVRLDIRGSVYNKQTTYRIMPELSRSASLVDGWINHSFHPMLQVRMGQFTVPFQWHRYISTAGQHFSERGMASEQFGFPSGRDIGVMMHGKNTQNTFSYGVGFFDGSGINTKFSNSRGNLISARLTKSLMGTLPASESDFQYSSKLNWSIGAGLQAANLNETRDWDLGRSAELNRRADWSTATVDTRFAISGWSLVATGYYRVVDPTAEDVKSYKGEAQKLSAGKIIIPNRLELVARASRMKLDRDDGDTRKNEWGVGFNIFHQGLDWKTRINYFRQTFEAQTERGVDSIVVQHDLYF